MDSPDYQDPVAGARELASDLVVGSQVGSYRILEVIGKGGMGTVYKAVHTGLNRIVALKVLPSASAQNPILRARFGREAQAAARLAHPNIVAVHDQGEWNGNFYMALEYVDGEDVYSLIRKRGQIPVPRSLEIIKEAVLALAHAHSKGVVHRDIKPSNLLIRRDGVVKLTDFGLALRTGDSGEAQVTRAGTTVGTLDYMAPEQARDSQLADIRSDIYSLGCTWYHMLTGQPPFAEASVADKLFSHAKRPPPAVRQLNPDVPEEVVAILGRMMEKEPSTRYQAPQDLLQELDQLRLRPGPASREELAHLAEAAPEPASVPRRTPPPMREAAAVNDDSTKTPKETIWTGWLRGDRWIYLTAGGGVFVAAVLIAYFSIRFADQPNYGSGVSGHPKRVLPSSPPALSEKPAITPRLGGRLAPSSQKSVRPPDSPERGARPIDDTSIAKNKSKPKPPDRSPALARSEIPPSDAASPRSVLSPEPMLLEGDPFIPEWHSGEPSLKAERVLQVRRGGSSESQMYPSLESACAAIRPDQPAVIEIADQGPFFLSEVRLPPASRVVLRAADGFSPLLVFEPNVEQFVSTLIHAVDAELEIEGLHFALLADSLARKADISLVRVDTGYVRLRGCSFTVAQSAARRDRSLGSSPRATPAPIGRRTRPRRPSLAGVSVTALQIGSNRGSTRRGAGGSDSGPRATCRGVIENCYLRGSVLTGVRTDQPSADVLINNSLLVSDIRPLIQVQAASPVSPTDQCIVRIVSSTLIAGQTAVQLNGAVGVPEPAATRFLVQDSVLAHPDVGAGVTMLSASVWPVAESEAALRAVSWKSLHSHYRGWKTLAAADPRGRSLATSADEWRQIWRDIQAEVTIDERPWPEEWTGLPDLVVPEELDFAREITSDSAPPGVRLRPVGCEIQNLPALPSYMWEWAFGGFQPPGISPSPQKARAVAQDRRVGLQVNLSDPQRDLGEILSRGQWDDDQVVVVRGSGTRLTSPIRVVNRSLRLRFDVPPGEILKLVPRSSGTATEAVIQVVGGDLEIAGGRFEIPPIAREVPRSFIDVQGGNVILQSCWFKGPMAGTGDFEGLLRWQPGKGRGGAPAHAEGAPVPEDREPLVARFTDCFLVGAGRLIEADLTDQSLLVENSVLVSTDSIFDIKIASMEADSAPAITLQQSTLWTERAFFSLESQADVPGGWRLPLRLLASRSIFASPLKLPGIEESTTLLQVDPRLFINGRIAWQGTDNVYDDITNYLLTGESDNPSSRQRFEEHWLRVWGQRHEVSPSYSDPIEWKSDRLLPGDLNPADFQFHFRASPVRRGMTGRASGAIIARLPPAAPTNSSR